MQSPVQVNRQNDLYVISIDNPPVNALSHGVRVGLLRAVHQLNAEDSVIGGVLVGMNDLFIGGADIREFGKPPLSPSLPMVVDAIEKSAKPLAAAISGMALGGGLEVALGCHFRVMRRSAKIGFPEVTLGLIPGAGGTQRLPRLIGIEAAVDIVCSGRKVDANEALNLALVDAVTNGDPLNDAIELIRSHSGCALPRASQMPAAVCRSAAFFEKKRQEISHRHRGLASPLRALDALQASTQLSFVDGLAREREIFLDLRGSPQAKALRHVFFAERSWAKLPSLHGVLPRPVHQVGVIGGGTMGAGITVALLLAGYQVTLIEVSDSALHRGVLNVDRALDGYITREKLTTSAKNSLMTSQLKTSTAYDDLSGADLVLEAVFEDLVVKESVFRSLDKVCRPDAILATNTSYLDVNEIAGFTQRPASVIGLHFFAPANIMKLIEIVRHDACAADVIVTGIALAKRLGKVGVISGVCDGFIGNRMLSICRKQADFMLEDGAMPWEIDEAMRVFGMPMGPFEVMDLSGLDISWANRKRLASTRDPRQRYVRIADKLCEAGFLGRKTGSGWYVYEGRSKTPNPAAEQIILDESELRGISRRKFSIEEIQSRILLSMINEGARILEEGIATRPQDIDLVQILGFGFPRWRGGPMFYADQMGLEEVLSAIRTICDSESEFGQPSKLIERLVEDGSTFHSLNERVDNP